MDDRIALRVGALRLARWRGRTRDAAWAASRLRLAGVTLEPGEARFARDVRVKFGRALRVARIRGPLAHTPNVTMPLLTDAGPSRRKRLLAALVGAVVLLGAVLLYFRYQEPAGDPEGAPAVQQAAVIETPPPPLRGRTQPGAAAPVAIAEATPAPTDAPAAAATPGPTGSGTGTGAGGSGGGTGNGNGTPAPTVAPTPSPQPSPTVTPNPFTVMHVYGRVVDSFSRQGIPNVCVSVGIVSCQGAPLTDAKGYFGPVDLTIGRILNWQLTFITPGYTNVAVRVPSRPGRVTIRDVLLRVAP